MSKHSIFRQSKHSINHLLWYVDPDRLLGTLSKGEMCQNKSVQANTAEFGQNLDLKWQLFYLLDSTSQECARKSWNPHFLVRVECPE